MHREAFLGLLCAHDPHICFLQEAQLRNGLGHCMKATLAPLGYSLVIGSHNLCAVVRHGLNLAPIALTVADKSSRAQRLALQIGALRVLIRHRHGHSSSPALRREYNDALATDEPGRLTIDIGDFNEYPDTDFTGCGCILFPSENTFRLNSADDRFSSCIDGCIVSQFLASAANVSALEPVPKVQHRPVLVQLGLHTDIHNRYRWALPEPALLGAWEDSSIRNFDSAILSDIDEAWRVWFNASGAAQASIVQQGSQGAWAIGGKDKEIAGLWKTLRRQQHDGRLDAAADTLSYITELIDDANTHRMAKWKQRIRTRGGAAAWVARKVADAKPPVLPAFGAETFTPTHIAYKLSKGLAKRWNTGVFLIKQRAGFCTTFAREPFDTSSVDICAPEPPAIRRPPIDLSLFDGIPPYTPPGAWTAEDILLYTPSGAPGLDGNTADWLQSLHKDSLLRLARLLDCADRGRFPLFWRHARVVLIPKGDDSPPDDRRPITIMALTYRLWARRHSAFINEWMARWKPSGLSGAVKNTGCPDVLWEVQLALTKAYSGDAPPVFLLSMDLEKCFDTLDLSNLNRISQHLGLDACTHALSNYARLSRLLFVEGEPSSIWLEGKYIQGIPQGCPLACILCNLTAVAWHKQCEAAVPAAKLYTILDDRLALANSWQQLEAILVATAELDKALGPTLNILKCARGLLGKRRRSYRPCPPTLQLNRIPLKASFRYLGIDLVLKRVANKQVASRRVAAFKARCSVVRILPRQQRGIGVADAVAALWCDGGFAYTRGQTEAMVSCSFLALAGNAKPGTLIRRSRPMAHVLGPRLHLTHPGVAQAYSSIRQLLRMFASGRLKPDDWSLLWAQRAIPFAGPVLQLRRALEGFKIQWIAATRLSTGGHSVSFDPGPALFAMAAIDRGKGLMNSRRVRGILHDVRAFLRFAVVHHEAIRRPKDFDGLQAGLSEDYDARKSMFALQLHSGGPALSIGGLWTHLGVSRLPYCLQTDQCPRCGTVETTMHRLWECRFNAELRSSLDSLCPGNVFPDGLPSCLARCGLIPADITSRYGVELSQAYIIQEYLLAVNAVATQVFTDARSGKELRFALAECKHLPSDAIFGVALPPLQKKRPVVVSIHQPPIARSGRPVFVLPAQPSAFEFTPTEPWVLSCDGSARADSSGWGFTVAGTALTSILDFCGPTAIDPCTATFIGASGHTNNVGELAALYFALCWILCTDHEGPFVLEFDSEYAAGSIRRFLRTRTNLTLVINARAIYDQVANKVIWKKVKAHTGLFLNERADLLANCGASGIVCGLPDVIRWAGFSS